MKYVDFTYEECSFQGVVKIIKVNETLKDKKDHAPYLCEIMHVLSTSFDAYKVGHTFHLEEAVLIADVDGPVSEETHPELFL